MSTERDKAGLDYNILCINARRENVDWINFDTTHYVLYVLFLAV